MIKVLFFARIREQLGVGTLSVQWLRETNTVSALVEHLTCCHNAQWAPVLRAQNVIKAVNQQVVTDDHPVADGDEVAFFPPVTGG